MKIKQGLSYLLKVIFLLSTPLVVLADSGSSNGTSASAIQMLESLSAAYSPLVNLAKGFCIIFGIALAVRGVFYLKTYGDLRTMTSSNTSLKVPITYFIASAVMLAIPSTINVLSFTLFQQNSTLLNYNSDTPAGINADALNAIVGLVYVIGLFAFIRGWMILVAIAQQSGGGQNSFGKAITHIIGGVLAMNIFSFTNIIWTTLGLQGIL